MSGGVSPGSCGAATFHGDGSMCSAGAFKQRVNRNNHTSDTILPASEVLKDTKRPAAISSQCVSSAPWLSAHHSQRPIARSERYRLLRSSARSLRTIWQRYTEIRAEMAYRIGRIHAVGAI
jgi:hypothetical protein